MLIFCDPQGRSPGSVITATVQGAVVDVGSGGGVIGVDAGVAAGAVLAVSS